MGPGQEADESVSQATDCNCTTSVIDHDREPFSSDAIDVEACTTQPDEAGALPPPYHHVSDLADMDWTEPATSEPARTPGVMLSSSQLESSDLDHLQSSDLVSHRINLMHHELDSAYSPASSPLSSAAPLGHLSRADILQDPALLDDGPPSTMSEQQDTTSIHTMPCDAQGSGSLPRTNPEDSATPVAHVAFKLGDYRRVSDRKRKAPQPFGGMINMGEYGSDYTTNASDVVDATVEPLSRKRQRVRKNVSANTAASPDSVDKKPRSEDWKHRLVPTRGSSRQSQPGDTIKVAPAEDLEQRARPQTARKSRAKRQSDLVEGSRRQSSRKVVSMQTLTRRDISRQLSQPKDQGYILSTEASASPLHQQHGVAMPEDTAYPPNPLISTVSMSETPKFPLSDPAPLSADEYSSLLAASKAIMLKTRFQDKPEPSGTPDVWADGRQALCETVLYYQAWQSACYISKGVLYSFMFDGNGHARDLLDHDVVIARAGGSMAKDKASGEMYQIKDQKDNNQTAAIRLAIEQQIPIVIFCGRDNTDAPTKMPARYCSLSWFKVTHMWTEQNTNRRGETHMNIKFRFEKLRTDEQSWWTPAGHAGQERYRVGAFDAPVHHTCKVCNRESPQIYLEGWMCLKPECRYFWLLPGGIEAVDAMLNYDPRFIKQKTPWSNEDPPHDIQPALPQPGSNIGDDVVFAMTRGICCGKCGKCTSRYMWRGWICSNPSCGFEYSFEHQLIPANILRDPRHPVSNRYSTSHDWADTAVVKSSLTFSHNYRIVTFTVRGIEGSITHLIANKTIFEEAKGPDAMFEAMQTQDCGLQRRKFVTGKEEYMTAFSNNRGMPYKFVASGESSSFDDAPWPLSETRSRLGWAARLVLGDEVDNNVGFNEMLTIGYFDGQNIKYHDDGEHGLGPTVASLSLGYPADMLFRVKAKHWTGVSKHGVFTDSHPIPGTMQYEQRLEAYVKLLDRFPPSSAETTMKRKDSGTGLIEIPYNVDKDRDVVMTSGSLDHDKLQSSSYSTAVTVVAGSTATSKEFSHGQCMLQDPRTATWSIAMQEGGRASESSMIWAPAESKDEADATRRIRPSTTKVASQVSKTGHLRKMACDLDLQDVVKDRKPWLRLRLSHGDIVVMHGRQIQEYLEHQVDPLGRLRFAMTCRTILPEHLRAEELPTYEVEPDDGHYDGSAIRELRS